MVVEVMAEVVVGVEGKVVEVMVKVAVGMVAAGAVAWVVVEVAV